MSVTTRAALAGTYGLSALTNDNTSLYVEDWKPYDDTQHRQRFYLDPNTITMANNDAHYIFQALNRDATVVERIEFRRYSSTYQARAEAVNDGSTWSSTSWVVFIGGRSPQIISLGSPFIISLDIPSWQVPLGGAHAEEGGLRCHQGVEEARRVREGRCSRTWCAA